MGEPRPMEVLTALRRLGYEDKPGVGDHVDLWKLVKDHPEGPITLHTGLDSGHFSKRDQARVRRQTKLDEDLWLRALDRKLPQDEYDKHLLTFAKADLVLHFWRHKFEKPSEP